MKNINVSVTEEVTSIQMYTPLGEMLCRPGHPATKKISSYAPVDLI